MYLAATFLLMLSVLTVIGTLISDILLAWLDPRIRVRGVTVASIQWKQRGLRSEARWSLEEESSMSPRSGN